MKVTKNQGRIKKTTGSSSIKPAKPAKPDSDTVDRKELTKKATKKAIEPEVLPPERSPGKHSDKSKGKFHDFRSKDDENMDREQLDKDEKDEFIGDESEATEMEEPEHFQVSGENEPESVLADEKSKQLVIQSSSEIQRDGDTEAEWGVQVRTDQTALKRYVNEIKKYPMLSHEEEAAYVRRMIQSGDKNAARALVSANLRLVVKIAYEYRNIYSNLMDLIQEGNLGLMKAVSKYDPSKGARVSYYSSWWIRSYILKYILDNFRLVKIGTTAAQKKLFYHLMREKQKIEAQGLIASPKLLAEKLNVKENEVSEMEMRIGSGGGEVSLDNPIGDNGGEGQPGRHLDSLTDEDEEGADSKLEQNQWLRKLRADLPKIKETLNDKENRILDERLLSEEPKTLQEIADAYGLTRERARQIEANVLKKLQKHFAKDI